MKHLFRIIFAVIVCSPLFAKEPVLLQNAEERQVGEYDAIYVSGWYEVLLVEGKEGKITLEGKASILENITTEVENGKLRVEWDKSASTSLFRSMSKIKIIIPVEDINEVQLSGSGSVVRETKLRSENLKAKLSGSGTLDLQVETSSITSGISGSGNVILSGQTKEFEAHVSGSGDIKAYALTAEDVTASISGSAKVKVHANNSVTARISGSGNVRYMGSATKIDSKVSGSGSVSKG